MPASPRKKILLVYPRFPVSFWSFGYIRQIGGFTAVMPPLGLAILAALTPPEFDVEIVDENIEAIGFDAECDVVALLLVQQILRACEAPLPFVCRP